MEKTGDTVINVSVPPGEVDPDVARMQRTSEEILSALASVQNSISCLASVTAGTVSKEGTEVLISLREIRDSLQAIHELHYKTTLVRGEEKK